MHIDETKALSFAGLITATCAFFDAKITLFLNPAAVVMPEFGWIAKAMGVVATLAVIWMNVETALTKRAERRKLNGDK